MCMCVNLCMWIDSQVYHSETTIDIIASQSCILCAYIILCCVILVWIVYTLYIFFTSKNYSLDFLLLFDAMCVFVTFSVDIFCVFVDFFRLSSFYFYFVFCMLVHTFAVFQRNDSFCAHKIPNLENLQERKKNTAATATSSNLEILFILHGV